MDGGRPVDAEQVTAALERRMQTRIAAEGTITLPAVPAMAEEYTNRCARTFADLGRPFSDDERAHLASVIDGQLREAFARSQRSSIAVSYRSPVAGALVYTVTTRCLTIEEAYHEWVATREPPLFGIEPDARVWALATESSDPAGVPVLDIGAGTGRNALALARRGHPVDAVEMTAKFAEIIRDEAAAGGLNVRVIQRDVFAQDTFLRPGYALIVLSEVVPEFRSAEELRRLFTLAAGCLRPGGRLVFNAFLTDPAYTPDDRARQFAQQAYSGFVTRAEMAVAAQDLPLELIADDRVLDYEKEHLPDGAWPPTSWYEGWVSGHDVFGLERGECPIDMHWLVYRRS